MFIKLSISDIFAAKYNEEIVAVLILSTIFPDILTELNEFQFTNKITSEE